MHGSASCALALNHDNRNHNHNHGYLSEHLRNPNGRKLKANLYYSLKTSLRFWDI